MTGFLFVLLLMVSFVSGIVLKSTRPLLDLNDRLIHLALTGPENEVVCPAALYYVIAAAHQLADQSARNTIQRALAIDTPSSVSRQIDQMAEKQRGSVRSFFRAYILPEVLFKCSTGRPTALQKRQRCDHLNALMASRGRQLDFSQPSAIDEINGDVLNATDGLIPDFLTYLHPDTRLVLVAALTFSAAWLPELAATPTGLRFRRPTGYQRVPAVQTAAPVRFLNASRDGVLGVALPYSVRSLTMEMFFFVAAAEDVDVAPLLRRHHYEKLAVASPLQTEVVFTFPKFKLKSEKRDYRGVARSLGLGAILEGGLGPDGNDKLDQLVQLSVMEVDERGTTAAGAAGASIIPRLGSDESMPRVVLTLDRPFVCSVMHVALGMPIFTAHVVDPVQG